MVSSPKLFTNNSPISPSPYATVKKTSARKPLNHFSEVLDFKQKTAVNRLSASRPNIKTTITGSMLWYSIPKRRGHTKINKCENIYIWIPQHLQVVQPPTANEIMKFSLDIHDEKWLVLKFYQRCLANNFIKERWVFKKRVDSST